ncbi:MAG: hypothetical protein AUK34_14545 [Ignavibacteria bacterium CG2_30_36_16]|nr:N-acetyltransferase [Ignavibacteria bacterium]OIP54761.1 MAG: hypothetical protein AUK34_14545 [Ignavibacteria bacterium CG2_30_36_16]PJB01855.1 MAG: N-acetyltransferase [Ignavibacteria bacterium CG_4_9_14_3_um_filter_36_18]
MNDEVKHSKEKQLFFIDIGNQRAELKYFMETENVMNVMNTYVPDSLRGKGIAGKLVEECLHYAKENSCRIIPSCSYVYSYIKKHPEFEAMLLNE